MISVRLMLLREVIMLFLFKIALQIAVLIERSAREQIKTRNKGLDNFMPNRKNVKNPTTENLLPENFSRIPFSTLRKACSVCKPHRAPIAPIVLSCFLASDRISASTSLMTC